MSVTEGTRVRGKERLAVTLDRDVVAFLRARAEAERASVSGALNRLVAEAMERAKVVAMEGGR